jgi:DNA-3-methyladenine glycosylase II
MRSALQHLKKSDPVIADIIRRVGPFALQYREPSFETLVRSIIYQLSGRVASVIFGRLHAAVGEDQLTPAGIMKLRPERMRKLGLSAQKTKYIRELAKHTRKGSVVFEALPGFDDAAVIDHLTRVKGIGVWTAQMFLMFALRRNDVLPVADLGIRSAMKKAYALEDLPKPAEMEKIAAAWKPYTSIACWYLWRSLENVG